MGSSAMGVRLRCSRWSQLVSIYRRDLRRGELFLKTNKAPAIGAPIRVQLLLPSGGALQFRGAVKRVLTAGDADPRGAGAVIALAPVDAETKLALENAVQAAISLEKKAAPPPAQASAQGTVRDNQALADTLSLDDGQLMRTAATDLHRALSTEASTFARLNPFQVLGVGYGASDSSVRTAFNELSKRYHPDRFVRYQSEDISQLAEELFIAARDAYKATATAELRASLHAEIKKQRRPRRPPPPELLRLSKRSRAAAPTAPQRPPAQRKPEAPPPPPLATELDPLIAFPRGRSLVDQRKFTDAAGLFSLESRRDRDNSAARAGVELAEGLRALEQGDRLEAAQRFEAVLDLHPANEVAARELAKMRRRASNERQGLLAKLMKGEE